MELYQRKGPDGRLQTPFWYYDITLPDGSRARRSTKKRKKTEAQSVMITAIREAEEEAKAGPKRTTLRDAISMYGDDLKGRGKPDYVARKYADKTFAQGSWSAVFGLPVSIKVDEVSERHITALKAARRAEGSSVGTISQELKMIRAAAIHAGRAGAVKADLRWNIPSAANKTRWLSQEEWQRVYAELDPDRPYHHKQGRTGTPPAYIMTERVMARDLFLALSLCGGRWSEVSRLTVDQVLEGDPVRVRLYGWKTGKERMVPAPPIVAEMLLRRATEAKEAGGTYLFPRTRNTRGGCSVQNGDRAGSWVPSNGAIKRAMDRAGVNAPHIVERQGVATVHSLRHTFASWLRQNGVGLADIQELLGHAGEAMTKRYAHIATNVTVDTATKVLSSLAAQALGSDTNAAQ